ncbi:hypothetical protein Aduo_006975 [Ancylostoma duodenale]
MIQKTLIQKEPQRGFCDLDDVEMALAWVEGLRWRLRGWRRRGYCFLFFDVAVSWKLRDGHRRELCGILQYCQAIPQSFGWLGLRHRSHSPSLVAWTARETGPETVGNDSNGANQRSQPGCRICMQTSA